MMENNSRDHTLVAGFLLVMAWVILLGLAVLVQANEAEDSFLNDVMSTVVGREIAPSANQAAHLCAALGFRLQGWPFECPKVRGINPGLPPLLDAINEARSQGRMCGAEWMPPVPPLRWSWELQEAARDASEDMRDKGYFGHTSPTGETARSWATRRGIPGGYRTILVMDFLLERKTKL